MILEKKYMRNDHNMSSVKSSTVTANTDDLSLVLESAWVS